MLTKTGNGYRNVCVKLTVR